MKMSIKIGWKSKWKIEKYKTEDYKLGKKPYAIERFEGNIGLQEGRQELIDLICGLGAPTAWNNANARLGVGNSNTAEDETQTGLLGASKAFVGMEATYPSRTAQTVEFRSVFGDGVAEFAWEEFTVVNAADDTGKNLVRKIISKGTKGTGETWTLSLSITFNSS